MLDVAKRIGLGLVAFALVGCNTTSDAHLECGPVRCPVAPGAYCEVDPVFRTRG